METNETISIRPGKTGELIVHLPYSPERIAKLKRIPGRLWHQAEGYWTVPYADDMPRRLTALFAGDKVELAPTLQATASPSFSPLVERVRQATKARHFSPSTEKQYAAWAERFLQRHPGVDPST